MQIAKKKREEKSGGEDGRVERLGLPIELGQDQRVEQACALMFRSDIGVAIVLRKVFLLSSILTSLTHASLSKASWR